VDGVIKAVASYYGLKPSDIKSERRHKSVATAVTLRIQTLVASGLRNLRRRPCARRPCARRRCAAKTCAAEPAPAPATALESSSHSKKKEIRIVVGPVDAVGIAPGKPGRSERR